MAMAADLSDERTLRRHDSAPAGGSFDSPFRRSFLGSRSPLCGTLGRTRLEPRQPVGDGAAPVTLAKSARWTLPISPTAADLKSSEFVPTESEYAIAAAHRRRLDEDLLAMVVGPSTLLPARQRVPFMPCILDRKDMLAKTRLKYPAHEMVIPVEQPTGLSKYLSYETGLEWHMAARQRRPRPRSTRPFEGRGGFVSPAEAEVREVGGA